MEKISIIQNEDCSIDDLTSSTRKDINALDSKNQTNRWHYFVGFKPKYKEIRSKSCDSLQRNKKKILMKCATSENFNNNEKIIKMPINKKPLLIEKLKQEKKRISEFLSFFINKNVSNFYKIHILLCHLLPPHFLANILSIFSIYTQNQIDSTCFLAPKCFCNDDLIVKTYTILKSFFSYWVLIIFLGYYSLFVHKSIRDNRNFKAIFFVFSFILVLLTYYETEGNEANIGTLVIYCVSQFYMLCTFAYCFWKSKIKIWSFLKKIEPEFEVFFLFFLNYIMTGYVFRPLNIFLQKTTPENGIYIFKMFFGVYIFLLQNIIPSMLVRWYKLMVSEKYPNMNPIYLLTRMFLCYIISSEISNLLDMNLNEWPAILLLINHIYFITIFYLQKNPLKLLIQNIFNKCKLTKKKAPESHIEKEFVWKFFSGFMLDFQIIMLTRLLTIRFTRHWLGIHHLTVFYKNCKLEISEDFVINDHMLIVIILVDIGIAGIFLWWFKRKNNKMFLYKKEKMNVLFRGYLIFLYHNFFELIMMDFRFSLH